MMRYCQISRNLYKHHFKKDNEGILFKIKKLNNLIARHEEYIAKPLLKYIDDRKNMTLRLSRDLGLSWEEKIILHKGPSAYSDITKLPNGNLGCFFEAGLNSPYEGIKFQEINLNNFKW